MPFVPLIEYHNHTHISIKFPLNFFLPPLSPVLLPVMLSALVLKLSLKVVTMPPVAAQMMMKAVDFLLLVPYPSDLLYPYSGDTSTLQSTL